MINRSQEEITQNWRKDWNEPLLSIRCIVFNHEEYIAQALDGFLMQETNFPFEVIVHDDASTDKTTDIIREYELKYPKIIKPIYEKENMYSKHDGSISRIMRDACKGKYLAFCEGDDYWTDSKKIQRQVDFLERNLDYALSSENGLVLYTKSGNVEPFSNEKTRDYTLDDLLIKRRFPTASVVIRREYTLDPLFLNMQWDTMIWGFLAQRGKVHFEPIMSSVYRRGSGVTESNKIAWAKTSERINCMVNTFFKPTKKVRLARNKILFYDYKSAWKVAIRQHLFCNAIKFCLKMMSISPKLFVKDLVVTIIKNKIVFLRTRFWRLYYSIVPAKK